MAKTFNRPAFQRMLVLVKTKKLEADYLYVMRYDRFSRNVRGTYIIWAELESYRITLRCLEDSSDDSEPTSALYRAIKIAEPEVDIRRRAKNRQMGIRLALKEGRYAIGKPPPGYS